jgi:hypothetical protein
MDEKAAINSRWIDHKNLDTWSAELDALRPPLSVNDVRVRIVYPQNRTTCRNHRERIIYYIFGTRAKESMAKWRVEEYQP